MDSNKAFFLKILKVKDLVSVHRLYCSLSPQSEKCYNSLIYGRPKSFIWFPAQIALIISHTPFRNIVLKIYAKYIYFILGAFDKSDNLVGFAHFVLHGHSNDNKLIARVGLAVKDDFQGQGIGSYLLSNLIDLAIVNKVDKLFLDVFSKNQKAINLYKKYGFELVRIKESRNNHKENMVEIYEMELILNRCEIKMG
jgi:ribosomal protein S18 acetylase RimI-like enzyme